MEVTFVVGAAIGIAIGIVVGDLNARRTAWNLQMQDWESTKATTEAGKVVKALVSDGSVTLAKCGTDVTVMCKSHADAMTVFDWLEEELTSDPVEKSK